MLLFYFMGWVIFSQTILMRIFTCCRKRRKLDINRYINNKTLGSPWTILSAHRGGSFERTENTVSAFRNAIEVGMDLLECDVHMTKDGVVIVSHDSDLNRLCGVNKKVKEVNYDELPPMKRSIPLHFSDGDYQLLADEDGKFTTLRELFEISSTKLISIDLKDDNDEMKPKVNELIKEFKREHLTLWGSMKPKEHNKIHRINPDIPQFFSGGQALLVYFLYYTGLLFLYPLPSEAFVVPLFTEKKIQIFGKMLDKSGRGLLVRMALVILVALLKNSKNLYRHLRKRGIFVCVWVLNEDEEFKEALQYAPEIDGMMTDCPTRLREFIKQNNKLD